MSQAGHTPAKEGGLRRSSLLAFGSFLARRGLVTTLALAMTVISVVGFGGVAVFFAHRGRFEALASLPLVASSVLAFSVGVLVSVGASSRAFRSDEDEGVRGLLRARGVTTTGYLAARVAGLSLTLAALVGGGSLLVGLIATLAARGRLPALHAAQSSFAAVVFSLAFAAVSAPVAIAALSARSRAGGYVTLLFVLVAPELLSPLLGRFVAERWLDVCSIPGALLAVRASLAPVGVDPFMLGRGLGALLVISLCALTFARIEVGGASLKHAGSARLPDR